MDFYTLLVLAAMIAPSIRLFIRAKKETHTADMFIAGAALIYAAFAFIGLSML